MGNAMKILFLESDHYEEYNCSNWRCVMPARALQRAGVQARVVHLLEWIKRGAETEELTSEADIIFLQRNIFMDVQPAVIDWLSREKLFVIDVDDAYEHMTASTGSPSYELWGNSRVEVDDGHGNKKLQVVKPSALDLLRNGVKLCGNLSSPSRVLVDDWKPYARTYLFPNFADCQLYHAFDAYHEPGKIYLGWGGSMTHLASWTMSGITGAIERLF